MAKATADFWPDFDQILVSETPASILRQQASLLGAKTNHFLEAEVISSSAGGKFLHRFFIKAPVLDYSYELFHISHGIDLYPVRTDTALLLHTEAELNSFLKKTLSSEKTKKVLASLMSQSAEQKK